MNDFINQIKPLFPVTYLLEKFVKLEFKSNAELFTMLVKLGVYLVVLLVSDLVLGLLGALLGILGIIWWVLGTLITLYCVAGIVLTLLDFFKVFEPKDNNQNN